MLTAVSLFAGIGGFDLALHRSGVQMVAAVEIDPAARGVLADQFPDTALITDVCEVTGDALRAAGFDPDRGILTAGWPCQGNSVAGRRKGMEDPRSGLWAHVARLLGELQPAWFIGENVPGLLSVNDGADMRLVLDDLDRLKYVVSADILDAQHFGVPQRRRRVVLLCQHASSILRTKTPSSAATITQCLTETLACVLAVARQRSLTAYPSSVSASWLSVDGLRRRMRLFGLDAGPTAWQTCLATLVAGLTRSQHEPDGSVSPCASHADASTPGMATSSSRPDATEPRSWSTALSWNRTWAAACDAARSCITSTPTSVITESAIYSCAQALLSISAHIARSTDSSPSYFAAASSVSTALQEFTSYARQAASNLFGDVAWADRWLDFARQAGGFLVAVGCAGDRAAPVEVLLEPESRNGDPAPRRTPGTGASVVAALRAGSGGGCGPDDNDATGGRLIAGRGHRVDAEGAANGHLVLAPTLTAGMGSNVGHPGDAGKDDAVLAVAAALTSRQGKGVDSDAIQTLVPLAFDAAQITSPENRANPKAGDPAMPLAATGSPHVAYAVRAKPGGIGQGHNTTYVAETLRSHPRPGSTGRGTPLAPMSIAVGQDFATGEDLAMPLTGSNGQPGTVAVPVAYDWQTDGSDRARPNISVDRTSSLQTEKRDAVATATAVRRLTPRECERLQGFPDDWTATSNGQSQSDSARYRQLGNAVALPVIEWIARRLAEVDQTVDDTWLDLREEVDAHA